MQSNVNVNVNDTYHVCTINVWGLQNDEKRTKVYLWLQENKYDIVFLQETHCTEKDKVRFNNGWDGEIYHSVTDSSHAKGVAIAISKKFACNVTKYNADSDGRRILLNVEYDGNTTTFVNMYAPNKAKDRKTFFSRCIKWVSKYRADTNSLILGGDMNCCLNDNDRSTDTHLHDNSRITYAKLIEQLGLIDCWKSEKNCKTSDHYTWCNHDNSVKSRLDYIFCSQEGNCKINEVKLKTVISAEKGKRVTDHKAVIVAFVKDSGRNRGPGYWKMNVQYLEDKEYITGINGIVENVQAEYMYSDICKRVVWDIAKIKIKEFSIRYCKTKAYQKRNRISELEKKLNSDCTFSKEARCTLESELDVLYTNKAKGAQIRSRAEWTEQGEKNSKYFLGLENSRQKTNVINAVNMGGKEETSTTGIMKCISEFYGTLYKSDCISDECIDRYLSDIVLPHKLLDEKRQQCEGKISENEVREVLGKMKKGKAPGSDGLPIEFYLAFWDKLKHLFCIMVSETADEGQLPSSTRHAIISLIHKKGDRKLLGNYRPISLTNTDYKIIAFVLANRLQGVLNTIIHQDQSGYIKGRYIGNNVRLVLDIYELCELEEREGALLMLDYQKAFDTLEWNFLYKVLSKFNFGNEFISWVKVLYDEPTFAVKNNGWISKKQRMYRGVRQGCPLSALLFVIAVEILGIEIRHNQCIKGFVVEETEHKISQYADDGIIMVSDTNSILVALDTVKAFSKVAGPKLNMQKVEGVWMGPLKHRMPNDYGGIKWTDGPVRCLGIYLGHDKHECDVKNWYEKLAQIDKLLQQWRRRNLSILGKVTIVKALALPKITYCAQLISPPEGFIVELDKVIKSFMSLRKQRLNVNTAIGTLENGGINFPDVECTFRSHKAAWVSRLLNTNCHSKGIVNYWCKKIGVDFDTIMKCNFMSVEEASIIRKIPKFYQEVLIAFNACKTVRPVADCTPNEVASDIIWGNQRYKHGGECLWIKSWIDSGIMYIKDIIDQQGKFLNEACMLNKLNRKCNWISEYVIVKKSCKNVEKKSIMLAGAQVNVKNKMETMYVKDKNYEIVDRKSNFYYDILRNQKFVRPYMQKVWCKELKLECLEYHETWSNIYVYNVRKIPLTKLAEFKYKVLSGILPCGYILSKWKKDIPSHCVVCKIKEDIQHMLYGCRKVNCIWETVGKAIHVDLQWKHIVLGYYQYQNVTTKSLNCLLSTVAYSIFKANNQCKWKGIDYQHYDVKHKVLADLKYFMSMQQYFDKTYISSNLLENVISNLNNN